MSATPYPEPLERSDFINIFGGVYEHSPWVAEAVYLKTDQGINAASMAALKGGCGWDMILRGRSRGDSIGMHS